MANSRKRATTQKLPIPEARGQQRIRFTLKSYERDKVVFTNLDDPEAICVLADGVPTISGLNPNTIYHIELRKGPMQGAARGGDLDRYKEYQLGFNGSWSLSYPEIEKLVEGPIITGQFYSLLIFPADG